MSTEPTPTAEAPRRGGRTQRMLERALELARTSSVVIVTTNWHHCEALRARLARLAGGAYPRNLRVTHSGPDLEAATFDVRHVLWDHHAHEVARARMHDELATLHRRIALLERDIARHEAIEVDQ